MDARERARKGWYGLQGPVAALDMVEHWTGVIRAAEQDARREAFERVMGFCYSQAALAHYPHSGEMEASHIAEFVRSLASKGEGR